MSRSSSKRAGRDPTKGSRPCSPLDYAHRTTWSKSWLYPLLLKAENTTSVRLRGREKAISEFQQCMKDAIRALSTASRMTGEEAQGYLEYLEPRIMESPAKVAEKISKLLSQEFRDQGWADKNKKIIDTNLETFRARIAVCESDEIFLASMLPGWMISQWDRWGMHSFVAARDLCRDLLELYPRRMKPLPTLDYFAQHVWVRLPGTVDAPERSVSLVILEGLDEDDRSLMFSFIHEVDEDSTKTSDDVPTNPYACLLLKEKDWNDPLGRPLDSFFTKSIMGTETAHDPFLLDTAKRALAVAMNLLYCLQDTEYVERETSSRKRGKFIESEAAKKGRTFNPITVVKVHTGLQKRIVDIWPQQDDPAEVVRKASKAHYVRKHEKTYWVLAKNVKDGEKTFGRKEINGKVRVAVKRSLSVFPRCGIPDEDYKRNIMTIPTNEEL